jgi:hypothetical protein
LHKFLFLFDWDQLERRENAAAAQSLGSCRMPHGLAAYQYADQPANLAIKHFL